MIDVVYIFFTVLLNIFLSFWFVRWSNLQYTTLEPKEYQNLVYKAAAYFLFLAAFTGFIPGLSLAAREGYFVDYIAVAKHVLINWLLWTHVICALIFVPFCIYQFYSGGKESMKENHIWSGYGVVLNWTFGMGIFGVVWNFGKPDFDAATFYTALIYVFSAVNFWIAIYFARQKDFATHKDYVFLGLVWIADPGLNRTMTWLSKLFFITPFHASGRSETFPPRIWVNWTLSWIIIITTSTTKRNGWGIQINFWCQFITGLVAFLGTSLSYLSVITTTALAIVQIIAFIIAWRHAYIHTRNTHRVA